MNIFKKHIEYLKDNPEGYWFKRKLYGWGWTPAKWQGWAALSVFLALVVLNLMRIDAGSKSMGDALTNFIPQTIILTVLFLLLCYKKGEKPKWMWGIPKKKEYMRLIFVRHGQTDFNKNKIVQGQEMDPPLNDTGIKQALEAAESLPNDIDFIISSPLKRALETAEILNRKLNKNIELSDNLKELKYGSLAGKPWSEIEEITGDKDVHQKEKDTLFDYRKFGGDSAEDLKQRVANFISEIKEKYPDKTILVSTHGGVIDAMHVLFPQKERTETHNATIHEFRF